MTRPDDKLVMTRDNFDDIAAALAACGALIFVGAAFEGRNELLGVDTKELSEAIRKFGNQLEQQIKLRVEGYGT